VPRAGSRKVNAYSLEFKLKAVRLRQLNGVQVQAVADALQPHPSMLSSFHSVKADVIPGRTFTTVAALRRESAATCSTTTTAVYIQRWAVVRRLTMNEQRRRTSVSTKPREDPGGWPPRLMPSGRQFPGTPTPVARARPWLIECAGRTVLRSQSL
jgi:transposase-like protein